MLPVRSEWMKWTTTKGLWVVSGVFLFLYLFVTGVAAFFPGDAFSAGETVMSGMALVSFLQLLGFALIAVPTMSMVTQEYRYHYQQITFLATPRRYQVALAKLIVAALWWVVVIVASYLLGVVVFLLFGDTQVMEGYSLFQDDNFQRLVWGLPLMTVMYIVLAQGLAWLLRKQAACLLVMIGMPFLIEPITILVPKIGDEIYRYMPFYNMNSFLDGVAIPEGFPLYGSLAYFAVLAVAVFGVSVYLLHQRDAG